MNSSDERKPNKLLRYARESRGWTQKRLADELSQRCNTTVDDNYVSRWESGKHRPSPYWQEQLSLLFGKSFEELGFVEPPPSPERLPTYISTGSQSGTATLSTPHQAIDLLLDASETTPEELAGAWLALQAGDLAVLFQDGWSADDILTSLQAVLKGVQALSNISRRAFGRRLLGLGAAAVIGDITIPVGKHISVEDTVHLCQTLGESIAVGWQLFHTAGNAQVLVIGQAQLELVKRVHSILPARDRAMFYSAIYDLIGKSYFFQERYEEALNAHQSAYIAALQAGDRWRVTQSLICQADGYQARGQHVEAIQILEEALRVLGTPHNEEQLRSKAHLLACWADNAMNLPGEDTTVQRQLEASGACLDRLGPNEEFDRAIWLQLSAKYALKSGDYMTALRYYEEAQAELPAHWIMRQVLVLLPMMVAYACKRDRDASLATAKKAAATLQVLNAPGLNKQFAESFRRGLLDSFPGDKHVQEFLNDTQQQYPLLPMTTGLER